MQNLKAEFSKSGVITIYSGAFIQGSLRASDPVFRLFICSFSIFYEDSEILGWIINI